MADWTYDVFLSFRGTDIRQRFIGHLYEALRCRGIHTFLDDEELERGEDITRTLLTAVEESRVAIPVFSATYATSSFCLDELVKIMECAKVKGQMVFPVFYEVDPSHVRRLRGSYGEALAKHEERFKNEEKNMERLEKWKVALEQAANLSGEHFKLGGESEREFIEKIVKVVSKWIRRASLHVADHPVGLESQVLKVNSLLDVGSGDGVHMVGIYGIGGIGKTTLACAVYNSVADSFEGVCFLGNVRENSMTRGLVHLQEMLLSKLAGERDIKLGDVNEGISMIKRRLCRKKVLLIVDDVDNIKQFKAIAGDSNWFGSGSRVIITTRNKGLLASHGVKRTYEVEKLNKENALDLIRWNAFKSDEVDPSYADVLNRTVTFASGLPLALEVIGSNLSGKNKEEWESALNQYKRIPTKEIQQILKVSFDDLEEDEQNFFLDIACCFNGYRLNYVRQILHAHHDVCPKNGIRVLVDKSLVKIDDDKVTLHDLIQDMGREIVRRESLEEPGKRSRMWFSKDIKHVLEENKGSNKIEIIKLAFPKFGEEVKWDGEAFKKMDNLKTLIIDNGHFSEGPKHLPNSLRVLKWQRYPSQILPSDFYPKKLAILQLPYCCLSSPNLYEMQKKFVNLRVLKFDWCQSIEQIPDVSVVANLEELSFCGCKNLNEVHKSVGLLDKLRMLDAHGCWKLRSFPALMLPSLEELYLSECSTLESFPEILGKMENLTNLELDETPIKEFPFSIRHLTRLQRLVLRCFQNGIVQLPSSIFVLTELKHLSIQYCEGLLLRIQDKGEEQVSSMVFSNQPHFNLSSCNASDEFLRVGVPWFSNVEKLDLSWNTFTIIPASIKGCSFLKKLILDYCENLQEIRGIPPKIEALSARLCISLKDLDLTLLPACAKECCSLKELFLNGCVNLQEIRGVPPNIEVLHAPKCISLTSSCRSMLLNQDLHKGSEDKKFWLLMPGTKIPEWFNHSCKGWSISFWCRNKFPAISLCVISEQSFTSFSPKLIINNHEVHQFSEFWLEYDHISILGLGQKLIKFKDKVDQLLSSNEWNHVEFSSDPVEWRGRGGVPEGTMQIGLHVFKQSSSMEDIRFTNPLKQQQQNLASLEPHVGQGKVSVSLLPPRELNDNVNWGSNSMVPKQVSSTTSVQASQDHRAKAPGESSQAPTFSKTQNIRTPSPTSSSGEASGQEIYIKTCHTALPTSFDESLGNKVSLIQDDIEIEAFYASLDAGTHVHSRSYDKAATTAPSEEAREALKIVQDFILNGASVLLQPERCSAIKASLDYLSKLSADDGISGEVKTLISEASLFFTHSSKDYIEVCMKIESTTSELQRADELEAGLEANKNQFREVVALENELLQKLAWIEKSKKEQEEQINVIKANLSAYESEKNMGPKRKRDIFEEGKTIKDQADKLREQEEQINAIKASLSAYESEKNMALKRKRDIFEEGKTLKAQIDELREKVPHLQHEQGLAKKTQAKIAAEWSGLGEKFKAIVVD